MENMISYTSVMSISNHKVLECKQGKIRKSDVFILDTLKKSHHVFFKGKCGVNERIELTLIFNQHDNGSISIKDSVKLYETLSISSIKLECPKSNAINILKNETKEVTFRIYSTDEDYADIILIVTNNNFRVSKSIIGIQTMNCVNRNMYIYQPLIVSKLASGF